MVLSGYRHEVRRRGCARARPAMSAVLALSMLFSGPAVAETLREALTLAYRTNPKLDAERARLRSSDEEVPRAKSGYRPKAAVSADSGYQKSSSGDDRLVGDRPLTESAGFEMDHWVAGKCPQCRMWTQMAASVGGGTSAGRRR